MTEEEQIQADIERYENISASIPDDGDMVEQANVFSSSTMSANVFLDLSVL